MPVLYVRKSNYHWLTLLALRLGMSVNGAANALIERLREEEDEVATGIEEAGIVSSAQLAPTPPASAGSDGGPEGAPTPVIAQTPWPAPNNGDKGQTSEVRSVASAFALPLGGSGCAGRECVRPDVCPSHEQRTAELGSRTRYQRTR